MANTLVTYARSPTAKRLNKRIWASLCIQARVKEADVPLVITTDTIKYNHGALIAKQRRHKLTTTKEG